VYPVSLSAMSTRVVGDLASTYPRSMWCPLWLCPNDDHYNVATTFNHNHHQTLTNHDFVLSSPTLRQMPSGIFERLDQHWDLVPLV
jgi:hypothetical protein